MAGGRGERGEKRDLFKLDPFSYRVNRRSALKMDLRRALAEKFLEFLGDYADETLIEYVIVLLCNGKDQYQAREGLKDFLGDDTERFVAWLWDYLSRRDVTVRSSRTTSNCKRIEAQGPSSKVQVHVGNTSLAKEEPGKQLKYHAGSQLPSDNLALSSRSLGKDIHGGIIHGGSLRREEGLHGSVTSRRPLQKKLRASVTEEKIQGKSSISRPRGTFSLEAAGAPYSYCPDENWHPKRGEKPHSSTRSSRNFNRPTEVVAIERNITSSNRVGKELKPVRRNVWDRLGKPLNETNNPYSKERNNSLLMLPAATFPPIHPLVTQNLPPALTLHPHAQAHFVSNSLSPEGVVRSPSSSTPIHVNGEIVNKLKRQFEQIESHLLANVVSSKSAERIPAKQRLGISVGPPQPLPAGNCFSSNIVDEPVLFHKGLKPEMFSNVESVNSDQRPPITPTEEKEALENSESGNSSQEPLCKVPEMKVKLDKMENDMQELPAKQAQLENSKPDTETNSSSGGFLPSFITHQKMLTIGTQPSQMEDMDLRTVLVTNVHFGATGEAVVSHFAKCGPVTKVVMLRDIITGKPKGVACVTFAKKDSVEKAISLSGTSLFSRTLKVICKAEAPAGLLEQPRQVWKPAHQLPSTSWNSLHCYPTTHHQWRRETNPSVSN